jgi:hypothetical protein
MRRRPAHGNRLKSEYNLLDSHEVAAVRDRPRQPEEE